MDKDLLTALYQEVSVLAEYSLDLQEDTRNHLQAICTQLNSALQEFETRLAATEEEQKTVAHQIQRVDQDVKKNKEILVTLDKEQKVLKDEQTTTMHRIGNLEEGQERAFHEIERVQEEQDFAADKIQRLETNQKETRTEVSTLKVEQCALGIKQSSLETEVGMVKKEITDLEKKIQTVDEKLQDSTPFLGATSRVCFQAPNRNQYFSGREHELRALEDAFDIAGSSTPCNKVIGICGLGGCGKTTLAVEYSWRCRHFYTGGVFWVSAESETFFRNTITELAFKLGTFNSNFDQCLRATLESLSRITLPFLLVVDNGDELELPDNVRKLLSGHWMRESKSHILVTTRRKAEEVQEAANIKSEDCVTLECLSEKEAISFMQKRTNITTGASGDESNQELDAVRVLVDELGGLPLALEQAGSHIKALQCTYSQYLEEFKKYNIKLLQETKAKASSENISKERLAVHTTWLMNFEYASQLAKESGLEELTSVVIEVSAFLSPDDIPCDVINQRYSLVEPQGDAPLEVSPVVVRNVVDILTKFSLFQSYSRDCFCVHRLVQQVIQSRCTEERREEVLLCGVRMLNFAFRNTNSPANVLKEFPGVNANEVPLQEKHSLSTWARLASHAVTLKSHLVEYVTSHQQSESRVFYAMETAELLEETAVYLSMSNQQMQAFEAQKLMLEIVAGLDLQEPNIEKMRLLANPVKIPLTDNQQRVLRLCSKQKNNSDETHNRQFTESNKETVKCLRLKGNDAFKMKEYESAIKIYSKAIEISKSHAVEPEDISVLYSNRSQCYLKLNKPLDALRDAEECVKSNPRSHKGFFRRALAMKMLFDEGNEEYRLAFLASAAMAITLDPEFKDEAQRRFGPSFSNASIKLVSSQDELEEVLREIAEGFKHQLSRQREWIVILKSGKYAFTANANTRRMFTQAIFIGDGDVEIKNAQVTIGQLSSYHFENIVFEKARFVAYNSFVSCIGCTFQSGVVSELPKCTSYKSCEGCPSCHSHYLSHGGDVPSGSANLQAREGSRSFVMRCHLHDSGGGVLSTNDGSFALVRDCKIHEHSLFPLEAREGGSLVAEGNEVFGGECGGVRLGSKAGPSRITKNKIYSNRIYGIIVFNDSKEILIESNEIYQNGAHGICLQGSSSMVARKNKIFENWLWGIDVFNKSSAQVSENIMHNNKFGGIRVGLSAYKVVLARNVVRDHNGPGILAGEAACGFMEMADALYLRWTGKTVQAAVPNLFPTIQSQQSPVVTENTDVRNVEGQQHPKQKLDSLGSRCAFCYQLPSEGIKFKSCTQCHKASYCSKECQTQHWGKHKPLCKALKNKFSVIVNVPSPGEKGYKASDRSTYHPDLKGIKQGPKPDRYSTKRFIVKIQVHEYGIYKPNIDLTVYDQSTDVYITFKNETIFHIIGQCGVLGLSKGNSKKIFCYASFEDKGKKLRIYLDELAPFQETW